MLVQAGEQPLFCNLFYRCFNPGGSIACSNVTAAPSPLYLIIWFQALSHFKLSHPPTSSNQSTLPNHRFAFRCITVSVSKKSAFIEPQQHGVNIPGAGQCIPMYNVSNSVPFPSTKANASKLFYTDDYNINPPNPVYFFINFL